VEDLFILKPNRRHQLLLGGRNFPTAKVKSGREIALEVHHEVRSRLFADGLFQFVKEVKVPSDLGAVSAKEQ